MTSYEDFFQKLGQQKGLESSEPQAILVHLLVSTPRRCPLCALILQRTFDNAVLLQNHAVHHHVAHEGICNDWLFCNNHAWLVQRIASPREGLRLYGALLAGVLKDLSAEEEKMPTELGSDREPAAAVQSAPHRYCPICEDVNGFSDLLVETAISALADEGFQHHYHQASGFCLPHLQDVLSKVPVGLIAEMVRNHFRSQVTLLIGELSRQLTKLSERSHHWKDVENVYLLAAERLFGARGL